MRRTSFFKVLAVVLSLIMAIGVMTGCSTKKDTATNLPKEEASDKDAANTDTTGTDAAAPAQNKTYKVLVAASDMSQSFYSWLANSIVKAYDSYADVEVTLVDLAGDTANVPTVIEQAISDNYDGLLIDKPSQDQDTDALLQEARNEGVYTVVVNNTTVDDGVSASVGLDNYSLGYTIGSTAAKLLPQNAEILVLKATAGNTGSEDRYNGWVKGLADAGRTDVKELDVKNSENWSKENAMAEMEDWLQVYTDFDAAYSMCDDMVTGMIEATEAAGIDVTTKQFYGIDGLANGCKAIKEGRMTATVLQNASEMGEFAAKLCYDMFTGKVTEVGPNKLEPTVITAENVDEIIAMHEANGMMQ